MYVVYFDQQMHACACVGMVENYEKHSKIIEKNLNVFYRFRPCERMRKHDFAGRNTQHLYFYVVRTVL